MVLYLIIEVGVFAVLLPHIHGAVRAHGGHFFRCRQLFKIMLHQHLIGHLFTKAIGRITGTPFFFQHAVRDIGGIKNFRIVLNRFGEIGIEIVAGETTEPEDVIFVRREFG